MVEKKIATIAVLCVATVLFLGLWSNSAQEARTLNSKYVKAIEDYDRLNSDYSDLEAEKTSLENDYSKLTSDYSKLSSDYSNLEAEKAALLGRIEQMNVTYEELLAKYDDLLVAHKPNTKVITLEGVTIKFTVARTVYNYTDDVKGLVEIYYTDGTPFLGFFQIGSCTEKGRYPTTSEWLYVAGKAVWWLRFPVFVIGPGTYRIYMAGLAGGGYAFPSDIIEATTFLIEAK